MGAEIARLPALSTAIAFTRYAPPGNGPVIHKMVWAQLVVEHGMVAKILPPPHNSMRATPTLSVAFALTSMLLPVHTPLRGEVMETAGGTVSLLPVVLVVVFDTVTVRDALAVRPPESVTVAVSVTEPLTAVLVFQLKPLLVPVYTGVPPAVSE